MNPWDIYEDSESDKKLWNKYIDNNCLFPINILFKYNKVKPLS